MSTTRYPYFTPRVKSQLAKNYGLSLSDEGFQRCFEVCKSHLSDDLARAAVGLDLKKIVHESGSFPKEMDSAVHHPSGSRTTFHGPMFVQVVSAKNIAQPSIRQDSSQGERCLYIQLTDGQSRAIAIEHRPVQALSLKKLPPGTKLILRNVVFERNFLLLEPGSVERLDGEVRHLAQEWRKRDLGPSKVWTNIIGAAKKDDPPPKFAKFTLGSAKEIRQRWAAEKKEKAKVADSSSGGRTAAKKTDGESGSTAAGESRGAHPKSKAQLRRQPTADMLRVGYEDMMAESGFAAGKLDRGIGQAAARAAQQERPSGGGGGAVVPSSDAAALPRFQMPSSSDDTHGDGDGHSHHGSAANAGEKGRKAATTNDKSTMIKVEAAARAGVRSAVVGSSNPLKDAISKYGSAGSANSNNRHRPDAEADANSAASSADTVRGRVRSLAIAMPQKGPASLDIVIDREDKWGGVCNGVIGTHLRDLLLQIPSGVQFEDYLVLPASLARIRASVQRLQEALQRKSTCDFTLESHVGAGKPRIINIAPVRLTQSLVGKRAVENGKPQPTTASPVVRQEKQPGPSFQSGSKGRKGHTAASSVEGTTTVPSQAVEQWQCSKCTLLNGMQLKQCTLCQAPRPPPRSEKEKNSNSGGGKNTRGTTTKEKKGGTPVSARGRPRGRRGDSEPGGTDEPPRTKEACRQFTTAGTCRYGTSCRYRHERDGDCDSTAQTTQHNNQQSKPARIGQTQRQPQKQQRRKPRPRPPPPPPQLSPTGGNRSKTNNTHDAPAVSALLKAGGAVPNQKMNILGSVLGQPNSSTRKSQNNRGSVATPLEDEHAAPNRTSKNTRQQHHRSGGSRPQAKGATAGTRNSQNVRHSGGKNASVESKKRQPPKQSQKSQSKPRQRSSKPNSTKQTSQQRPQQKKQPAQKRAPPQQRPRSGLKFNADAKPFVPPSAGTN